MKSCDSQAPISRIIASVVVVVVVVSKYGECGLACLPKVGQLRACTIVTRSLRVANFASLVLVT